MKKLFLRLKEKKEQAEKNTGRDEFREVLCYPAVKVAGIAVILSLPVALLSLCFPAFAEYYSRTVGEFLRMVLSKITGILPFSLAETIIVCGGIYVVAGTVYGFVEMFRKSDTVSQFELNFNRRITCAVLSFLAIYNFTFAPCNRRFDLEDNMGLVRSPLTAQQLYDCMVIVNDELEKCIEKGDIRFSADGSSCMPWSYAELNEKLNRAFAEYSKDHEYVGGFSSRVKRVALSPLMTYTHISGIYIPYTGEVNVNTNYPDFVVTFTHAHEMAHQRGIAREDEANFVAFTLLYEHGDNYMRYCALTELYDYLGDALFSADPGLFEKMLYISHPTVIREMIAFENFFVPYADSAASEIMGAVNDTSIKLRGDSAGAKSYNMMVELAAAYFGVTDNNG
ncbi:MAG: DUF3810 domain-containing protein [Clostridia bacterium]|nr:DUF3810 domain-containing protein [Clostridia bacterium]